MTGYDPIPVGYVKRISRTNANEFDTSDGLFRAPQHPSSHCPPRYLGGGSSWAAVTGGDRHFHVALLGHYAHSTVASVT